MPRQKRTLIDNGIYHLFNRGNNRQPLFHAPADFKTCLKLILYAKEKYAVTIFHYCLMENHYHFLAQIKKAGDLSFFAHSFQFRYAQYSKCLYGSTGHMFQERFRSLLIGEESYYLQCGRYIERNPVKSGKVVRAEDYPFSSAGYYVFGRKDPLVTPNPYYLGLAKTNTLRRRKYRDFLKIDEPYRHLLDKTIGTM